ncbi:unnamed protein product [Ixodes persulcatus]
MVVPSIAAARRFRQRGYCETETGFGRPAKLQLFSPTLSSFFSPSLYLFLEARSPVTAACPVNDAWMPWESRLPYFLLWKPPRSVVRSTCRRRRAACRLQKFLALKKNKNASSAGELVYILHMLIHLETALERSYNSKAARFERQNTLFVLSLLLI